MWVVHLYQLTNFGLKKYLQFIGKNKFYQHEVKLKKFGCLLTKVEKW